MADEEKEAQEKKGPATALGSKPEEEAEKPEKNKKKPDNEEPGETIKPPSTGNPLEDLISAAITMAINLLIQLLRTPTVIIRDIGKAIFNKASPSDEDKKTPTPPNNETKKEEVVDNTKSNSNNITAVKKETPTVASQNTAASSKENNTTEPAPTRQRKESSQGSRRTSSQLHDSNSNKPANEGAIRMQSNRESRRGRIRDNTQTPAPTPSSPGQKH